MASHQAKQEQQPREPGDKLARHRRLHNSHTGQLGGPRAHIAHLYMVAMAVAALRVVAQQQVRVLVSQQGSKLSCRYLDVSARESGPAWRVFEQDRSVSTVRVAEMHGPLRAEDSGARP